LKEISGKTSDSKWQYDASIDCQSWELGKLQQVVVESNCPILGENQIDLLKAGLNDFFFLAL